MENKCEHCTLFASKRTELLNSCETVFEAASKLKDLIGETQDLPAPPSLESVELAPPFPDKNYNIMDHKPSSPEDVKVTVYAISASEPDAFIDRWLHSMSGADHIVVLVTKVNDPNYDTFLKYTEQPEFKDKLIVAQKDIKPWRFDVARNESLALIPLNKTDVCVCTDIDEILISDFFPDFRRTVWEHWGSPRYNYRFAWSHDDNGDPKIVFWYDKAHHPRGYYWKFPVHEALTCDSLPDYHYSDTAASLDANKIYLRHFPDQTKSRSSYLPLLEMRTRLFPDDNIGKYYLVREYSFHSRTADVFAAGIPLFNTFASNPKTDDWHMMPALCGLLGSCFDYGPTRDIAQAFFKHGLKADPKTRTLYIKLAASLVYSGKPNAALEVLDLMEKNSVFVEDWRFSPVDWRDFRKLQIKANAFSWKRDYDTAYTIFQQAEKDIKTEDDRRDASSFGFFDDMEFARTRSSFNNDTKKETPTE